MPRAVPRPAAAGHTCRPLGQQHDPQAALVLSAALRSGGSLPAAGREPGRPGRPPAFKRGIRTRRLRRRPQRCSTRPGRPRLGSVPVAVDGDRLPPWRDGARCAGSTSISTADLGVQRAPRRRAADSWRRAPSRARARRRARPADGRVPPRASAPASTPMRGAWLRAPRDGFVFSLDPDGSGRCSRVGQPALSADGRPARTPQHAAARPPALHGHRAARRRRRSPHCRRRLGHGDGGATTLRIYAGRVTEADRRAATTLADLMPQPGSAQRQPRAARTNASPPTCAPSCGRPLPPASRCRPSPSSPGRYNVAVGTAQRAVATLRAEGLIQVSRGRRATVSG